MFEILKVKPRRIWRKLCLDICKSNSWKWLYFHSPVPNTTFWKKKKKWEIKKKKTYEQGKVSINGSLEWCKSKQTLKLVRWTWTRIWLHHLVIQSWSCDLPFWYLAFSSLLNKVRIRLPWRCIVGNNICRSSEYSLWLFVGFQLIITTE